MALFYSLLMTDLLVYHAGFTLLLPEVAGRDPDAVLAAELAEKRKGRAA